MFAFSSNENAVLERKADIGEGSRSVASRDIDYYYELDKCAEWTKKNELNKVLPLGFFFFFAVLFRLHLIACRAVTRRSIVRVLFNSVKHSA